MKKILILSLFVFLGISNAQVYEQVVKNRDSLVVHRTELNSHESRIDSVNNRIGYHSILEYYASGIITAPYSIGGATSTQTSTAIDNAISAIGSAPTILEFPTNNTYDAGGVVKTFPSNIVVRIGTGAKFQDSVIIKGGFEGDLTQHFVSGANLDSAKITKIYPQWFGVVLDASTDNASMLQKTFNSVPSGKIVELMSSSEDTMIIGSAVFPKSKTTFTGNIVIKAKNNLDSAATLLNLELTNNVTISGFTFDGNKANQTEPEHLRLIRSYGSNNMTIENCVFINGNGYRTLQFYWVDSLGSVKPDTNIVIKNNKFYHDNGNAIELRGSVNPTVSGNYFEDWGVANVVYGNAVALQDNGTGAKISNNMFLNISGVLFSVEANGLWEGVTISDNTMDGDYTGISGYMAHSSFTGNNFINGTLGTHRNGFEIAGTGNVISNNRLSNGTIAILSSTTTNGSGFSTLSKFTNIIGNTIIASGTNSRAIEIGGDGIGMTLSYINVIGNNIDVSDATGVSMGGIYIGLYGDYSMTNHIKIQGNTILGDGTTGSGIRLLGIGVTASSGDIDISGNTVDSCNHGIELPSDDSFDEVTITKNYLYSNITPISDPTTGGTIRKIDNILVKGGGFASSGADVTVNFKGGIQFTGAEYINIADNANLNFGNKPFTLEYFGTYNASSTLALVGESIMGKDHAYYMEFSSQGKLTFRSQDTTLNYISSAFTSGQTYDIVLVVNPMDSTLYTYVNGSLDYSSILQPIYGGGAISHSHTGGYFSIGRDTAGLAKSKEAIHRIRVFNRPLTSSEIYSYYNEGRTDLNWTSYADKGAANTLISGYDTTKVNDTVAVSKFKNIYWIRGNADSLKIVGKKNYYNNTRITYTTSGMIYMEYDDSLGVYGDLTNSELFYAGAVLELLPDSSSASGWTDASGNGLNGTFVGGTPIILNTFDELLWILLLIGIFVTFITILVRKRFG